VPRQSFLGSTPCGSSERSPSRERGLEHRDPQASDRGRHPGRLHHDLLHGGSPYAMAAACRG
jgi:hypothetical protein